MLCVQVPWSACDQVLVYRCHDQIVTRFMCAGTTVRLWWGLYVQVQRSLWSGGGQDISAGLRWSHDRQKVSRLNCTTSSDTLLSLRQSSPSNSKGEKMYEVGTFAKEMKGLIWRLPASHVQDCHFAIVLDDVFFNFSHLFGSVDCGPFFFFFF